MKSLPTGDALETVKEEMRLSMFDYDSIKSEDVADADTPVTVNVIKQNGSWYLESSSFL